jgi:hypothetical protein
MTEAEKPKKTAYEQLNSVRRKFVDFIVQGYTGTDAVRAISKRWTRPDIKASKWRKEQLVRTAIEERQAEQMEDAGVTNAQILLDIAQLSNVSVKRLVWCADETLPEGAAVGQPKKLHELDDVTARCIQSIEYSKDGALKARVVDRLAAKKLLGQYKRLFTESHEINLGEKTLEQLLEASWNRPRPSDESKCDPARALHLGMVAFDETGARICSKCRQAVPDLPPALDL